MKILKLPPYYAPEQISSSHLTNDLEQAYVEAGYELEIYCPTPTRGVSEEVRSIYKNKKYEEKFDGKIKIHRFPMFREQKNTVLRALRYILVNLIQFYKGCRAKDIDLIMASSTPPTQGLMCSFLKRIKGVPFVYTLQDVFPDSLVNAKMTKKGSLIWKIGRKIEDFTYRSADKIIVISNDIKDNISRKGVNEHKVKVIPNWIKPENIKYINKTDNLLIKKYNINKDNFIIVYAGNLGRAQGLDILIEAAVLLKDKKDISFCIFGDGVEKERLISLIGKKELTNICIYPLQPSNMVSYVYSLGDACVVTCKKGNGSNAFPSKTWSIMACSRPIIAAFDRNSQLSKCIDEFRFGLCIEPENVIEFVKAIKFLKDNKEKSILMGVNGRKAIELNFNDKISTSKYIDIIDSFLK